MTDESLEPLDVHDTEAATELHDRVVSMFGKISVFMALNRSYLKHAEEYL